MPHVLGIYSLLGLFLAMAESVFWALYPVALQAWG